MQLILFPLLKMKSKRKFEIYYTDERDRNGGEENKEQSKKNVYMYICMYTGMCLCALDSLFSLVFSESKNKVIAKLTTQLRVVQDQLFYFIFSMSKKSLS